jgi:hypothetical protein
MGELPRGENVVDENAVVDAFFVPTYQMGELPCGENVADENAVGFP